MAAETETVWNIGQHYDIIKGGCVDQELYFNDGWYLNASTFKDQISGTLYYWRSYRNDGKDYMMSYKTNRRNTSA